MSLKILRMDAGLSQSELAQASGINVRTIQRLEQGQRASLKTLQALSSGLAIPVTTLKQHIATQTFENTSAGRVVFLDNLRSFLVFLVVLYHCGIVYESSGIGAYFWLVDDKATNDLSGAVNLIIDTFVMFGLFFISGYFTPSSLQYKSAREFLLAKCKRLVLPWFVAVVTLLPLYKVIFLASRGLPQESWTSYFHITNGIISQSWLWFLPVLFLFDMTFLAMSRIKQKSLSLHRSWTTKQIVAGLVVFFLVIGVFFQVNGLNGWTKTWLVDFQNERLIMYFAIYLLGASFYQRQVFHQVWQTKKLTLLVNCTAWLPVNLYLAMIIYTLFNPGNYLVSPIVDATLKHVFLQLTMLTLLYSAIVCCKHFFDRPSGFGRWINRNSYGTYIIHTIVLGAIALILQPLVLPSLVKYLVLVMTTYISCQILVSVYRMSVSSAKS